MPNQQGHSASLPSTSKTTPRESTGRLSTQKGKSPKNSIKKEKTTSVSPAKTKSEKRKPDCNDVKPPKKKIKVMHVVVIGIIFTVSLLYIFITAHWGVRRVVLSSFNIPLHLISRVSKTNTSSFTRICRALFIHIY